MTPVISVLLPAYNAAETIQTSIASLQAQTFRAWELLLIDDGSTDATATLVAELALTDSRIRLFQRPHLGIVEALNFGLARAEGEWVARQDADDLSHPERLSKQLQFARANREVDLVSCLVTHEAGGTWSAPSTDTRGYAAYCAWLNSVRSSEEIYLASFIESPLAHPTVFFRRELIDRFGGYRDGDFPEDFELWLRWLKAGVRMAKVPEVLYTWTDRPSRLSRVDPRYHVDAFHRIKASWIASWIKSRNQSEMIVWGAGPTSRKRASFLEGHGCEITAYIDVDEKRRGQSIQGRPVFLIDEFERWPKRPIVSYVGARGAREEVRDFLLKKGLVEQTDFLICS